MGRCPTVRLLMRYMRDKAYSTIQRLAVRTIPVMRYRRVTHLRIRELTLDIDYLLDDFLSRLISVSVVNGNTYACNLLGLLQKKSSQLTSFSCEYVVGHVIPLYFPTSLTKLHLPPASITVDEIMDQCPILIDCNLPTDRVRSNAISANYYSPEEVSPSITSVSLQSLHVGFNSSTKNVSINCPNLTTLTLSYRTNLEAVKKIVESCPLLTCLSIFRIDDTTESISTIASLKYLSTLELFRIGTMRLMDDNDTVLTASSLPPTLTCLAVHDDSVDVEFNQPKPDLLSLTCRQVYGELPRSLHKLSSHIVNAVYRGTSLVELATKQFSWEGELPRSLTSLTYNASYANVNTDDIPVDLPTRLRRLIIRGNWAIVPRTWSFSHLTEVECSVAVSEKQYSECRAKGASSLLVHI